MKSDIALHEIMRIDEYDEEHAEASSVDKHTQDEAQMKDEASSVGVATQEPTAPEIDRVESPISVDIPTDTVINYDEPPTTEPEDSAAVELLVNNDETATASGDTAAEALMNPDETAHDAAANSAETDTTKYDEPPTELIDAPADLTVMSNDTNPSELAELAAVEDPIEPDEISTESAALPTVPASDDEQDTSDRMDLPMAEDIMYDGQTSIEDPLAKRLEAIPANTVGFFEEVVATSSTFFKNNRQLLTNLGVIFVAFMVTKLAFAGLNAIDDLPLVSPLLKLVGLYYVLQFIWNYLIRQQDRQKLVEKINTTKAEVLGDRD